MVALLILLLSNFNAFAQKTTIWLVNHAERAEGKDAGLSKTGQQRAQGLAKALKHEGVEVIYITSQKCSAETAAPLSAKARILARVYTDSVKKFVNIIRNNFAGKKVLIIADHTTIIKFLYEFGVDSPFDSLDKEDFDQLFTITIKESGEADLAIRYYGDEHHVTPIPQQYLLDNYYPGYTPRTPIN